MERGYAGDSMAQEPAGHRTMSQYSYMGLEVCRRVQCTSPLPGPDSVAYSFDGGSGGDVDPGGRSNWADIDQPFPLHRQSIPPSNGPFDGYKSCLNNTSAHGVDIVGMMKRMEWDCDIVG
jgi:hypothetical protein